MIHDCDWGLLSDDHDDCHYPATSSVSAFWRDPYGSHEIGAELCEGHLRALALITPDEATFDVTPLDR